MIRILVYVILYQNDRELSFSGIDFEAVCIKRNLVWPG